MATGPEHYREAERLLALLPDMDLGSRAEAGTIAEAQVHATLALAAGFAGVTLADDDSPTARALIESWQSVISGEVSSQ